MAEDQSPPQDEIAGGSWDEHGAFVIGDDDGDAVDASDSILEIDLPEEPATDTIALELELNETKASLLRVRADLDNFRKRVEREKAEWTDRVSMALLRDVLPVVDNFERALQSKETADYDGFAEGVEMIYRQMTDFLEKMEVRRMIVAGVVFDPRVHEAVAAIESDDVTEEIVAQEIIPGYTYKVKVLRAAQVQVAKPSAEALDRLESGVQQEEGELGEAPLEEEEEVKPKGISVRELQEKLGNADVHNE